MLEIQLNKCTPFFLLSTHRDNKRLFVHFMHISLLVCQVFFYLLNSTSRILGGRHTPKKRWWKKQPKSIRNDMTLTCDEEFAMTTQLNNFTAIFFMDGSQPTSKRWKFTKQFGLNELPLFAIAPTR